MIDGNKLLFIRGSVGLSVRDLAKKSNVSPSTINRIETGKSKGSILVASKLAKALGSDLHVIFMVDRNE